MNPFDGVTDVHRSTWSRLTRLHLASAGLPTQTSRTDDPERRHEDPSAAL
jgi:hypothetical protein